jgi:hypothetical protein
MGSGGSPALLPPIKKIVVEDRVSFGKAEQSLRVCGVLPCGSLPDAGPAIEPGQASRALSTARLHVLPRFHLPPINVVVSHGPSGVLRPGRIHLGQGFPLRCVQRFSRPGMATRRCIWQHSRYTRGQSVPVLSY